MEMNHPPGLKPHSVEGGNLSDITSAGSIYHFLLDLHKQFGPIASFWWGKKYTVSIASLELFQEQLELTERPGEPYKTFNPFLFGSQSITFTNLEDGINRRLHYKKALNKDAVERYIPQFQEVADELASKWSKMVNVSSIPLTRDTSLYSVQAVLHTLFGNLIKNESDELDFRADADELWANIEASFINPRAEKQTKHMEEDRKELNKIIGNMIKDRKASPAKNRDEALLDCILSYTDDEEIQFADALEFSTSGQYVLDYYLTSVFYQIASNNDVQQRLYEEIQSVLGDEALSGTNIRELVYLQQVLDEALRCSIPGCFGARVQYIDSKLGGYDIPKNTPVIHAINAAMKNESIWPDPERFDPERFSKENCEKRSSLWFCPYGVGNRDCPVRHFPYPAAAVVLVTLLRKFKIRLVDDQQKLAISYGLVHHITEEIFIKLEQR